MSANEKENVTPEEFIDVPTNLSSNELIDIPQTLSYNSTSTTNTSAGSSSRAIGDGMCTILNQCITGQACDTCQINLDCGNCQSSCQDCQTTCEKSCQAMCESACLLKCEVSCQNCEGACEDTCQKSCQNCEGACMSGCQVSCQNCQGASCQTCQTTCQNICQNCQGVACQTCQTACESSCQNCQGASCQTCQYACQYACQNCQGASCQTCQYACQYACQNCQGASCQTCQNGESGCGICETTCQNLPRPQNWSWTSPVGQGIEVSYLNNKDVWYLTAEEWNQFTARINQFRLYKCFPSAQFTTAIKGEPMLAAQANEAVNAINDMNPPTPVPNLVSSNDPVIAQFIIGLTNSLNSLN